jgi:SAM-dependent methyltransferase
MEIAVHAVEAVVEETHWWFVGRRRLFAREIAALSLSPRARVLDIGTSTGTNLRMLRDAGYERVLGVDQSPEAIRHCETKGLGPVHQGDICDLPFDDGSFDLVLATDIVEHVVDDALALREVARVLAPGGALLLTVPAFQSLWGLQDDVAQHRRRYRMHELLRIVQGAGLKPLRRYHFNYLLFVPIWLARRFIGLLRLPLRSEAEVNTPLLNAVLSGIFRFDTLTSPVLRPWFGVSILIIARKDRDHAGP